MEIEGVEFDCFGVVFFVVFVVVWFVKFGDVGWVFWVDGYGGRGDDVGGFDLGEDGFVEIVEGGEFGFKGLWGGVEGGDGFGFGVDG